MQFNLADLFESVADAVPDREAIVCGDRRLRYRDLDERATRLAHALLARGVRRGAHLGLYLYNGTEYVEGMLAAYKIGAVPINVNYRYVADELRYLFDDADLQAVIVHGELAPRLKDLLGPALPKLELVVVVDDGSDCDFGGPGAVDYDAIVAEAAAERDFGERSADDLYILYTGGTTGMPKGVMWRHEDIFFAAFGGGNPMGVPIERPEDLADKAAAKEAQFVMLPVAPLMHGAAQWATFIGLFGGDRIVLSPDRRFDPHAIWDLVAAEGVQSLAIVGDAMGRPLAEALADPASSHDTSSLIVLGSGGAILSASVKSQIAAQVPGVMILDSFGVSETGFQGRGAADAPDGRGPRFVVDDHTTVLDDEMRPIAPGSGVVGMLARRGRTPLGYYKDTEKSARTFVEAHGERFALPGDMATVEADGSITLLGRGSVCINSGGEKIFPEEVEATLKSHADVFDAVVVGVPDERWGQRVAAVVQPRPGRTPTLEELATHCRAAVAGYKVPRELHLVPEIVRQPSGKPDYRWARRTAVGPP